MINSGRRTLQGCSVGRGWVQGRIRCLDDLNDGITLKHLASHQIDGEIQAFDGAVAAVVERMRLVLAKLQASNSFIAEGGDVLSAHVSIAEDPDLRERVVRVLRSSQINAAWGLERVLEEVQVEFGALDDPYIAARMLDIRQVFHRLQRELAGGQTSESTVPELRDGEILLARDLEPVLALGILEQKPVAVITEEGSATSHLALLCRAMRVPAMVGVKSATESLVAGDQVLLDLEEGFLVRDPDRRDIALAQVHLVESELHLADPELPAVTRDGAQITLLANIDTVSALSDAVSEGAQGIGLFRSEYLYLRSADGDSEMQVQTYQRILDEIPGTVTIRTFDIGSDKLPLGSSWEPNPALGLRALRSYQLDPKVFRVQLRNLMHVASADARLRILLPMVDGLASWRWAAEEVEQVALAEGKQRGTDFLLGAMIELPSAVFVADELASCSDFFSLGTNDLVQYLLAVDRQNPGLARHARVTHPAVLRALKQVIDAGTRHQIPMSCCGEMAASPIGIMILVGMGLRELSVPPLDLGMARTFLRRSEVSVFKGLVQRALTMTCDQEISELFTEHYQDWKLDQSR